VKGSREYELSAIYHPNNNIRFVGNGWVEDGFVFTIISQEGDVQLVAAL
jgi:hypothetical protein